MDNKIQKEMKITCCKNVNNTCSKNKLQKCKSTVRKNVGKRTER